MSRIAVTGASGFIGRHLVPLLLESGHEVRALARQTFVNKDSDGRIDVVRGDVRDREAVRSVVEGCEVVVHLAGSISSGEDVTEIVMVGTRAVTEASRATGVKRFLYMSCLGAGATASPFYAAKWRAEMAVQESGLPYTVLRPSLVVGRGDGVLQPLTTLIKVAPVIPIPGRGKQRCQPIDVRDLARCIEVAVSGDEWENEVVAVGGPMFVSFRQIVDLLEGQVGVLKPKVLVPVRWLPAVSRLLPARSRALFLEPRVAQFQQGAVVSPGIVRRSFGFEPRSIVASLGEYLR